jgi:hypothetical protein
VIVAVGDLPVGIDAFPVELFDGGAKFFEFFLGASVFLAELGALLLHADQFLGLGSFDYL